MNLLRDDVKKLYFTFLASALGSTLVTNIYSTVDFICVGQYAGPIGSAAISCVNPFWPIMLSLGFLFGMGGAVMLNNRRGAGEFHSSNEFFTLATILSLISSAIIFFLFTIYAEPLLVFFGAEGEILAAALEYIRPIAFISPTFTLCATISLFVRNDGEAALPTVATVIGGVVNVFGDVFFVFDFGLGLGMLGAGLATALGQLVSFLIIVGYFLSKKCKLRFTKIKGFSKKLFKIISVGSAMFITELSFGVCSIVFNKIIIKNLSADHLAVYGTASGVLIMFYCFFYALGGALQPIVSANYGANDLTRAKKTLEIALVSSLVLGTLFALSVQLFPGFILKAFMDVTDNIMIIGPPILRIYCIHLPLVGICIVGYYYLQSVLRQKESFLITLLRGLILPLILVFILPLAFGIDSIWWSVPIAELMTLAVCVVLLFKKDKKEPDTLRDEL